MSKTYNKYKVSLIYPVSIDMTIIAEDEYSAYELAVDEVSVEEYWGSDSIGFRCYNEQIEINSVNADGCFEENSIVLDEENVDNPNDDDCYDDDDDVDDEDDYDEEEEYEYYCEE